MSGPSITDSEGLPFGFESFTLIGKTPMPTKQFEEFLTAGNPIQLDRTEAGPRHDELPLGRDVVDFP
jgi:hypothetical protein